MLGKDEFAKQIRQALSHLSDYVYLQNLALVKTLSYSEQSIDRSIRKLRMELLDSIEQLKPAADVSSLAKEQRPYLLMSGRYIEGMSIPELAEELMIGERQLYREHKRALNTITELMWDRLSEKLAAASVDEGAEATEAVRVEAEQLISQAQSENLNLSTIVDGVLATLTPFARNHNIMLINHLPDDFPSIRADRIVVRQGLFELISYALSRAVGGEVVVEGAANTEVKIFIAATGKPQSNLTTAVDLDVSRQLVASLGGRVKITDASEQWQATIFLPASEKISILVMDDNAGLVKLFKRYLAGSGYRLVEAHTTDQAIQRAREMSLKLIVLDIMMPQQDGWEVLQYLRAAPETKEVPIVVCSVLNQPEIAASLGASDFLSKPVTQDALLAKVDQWCGAQPGSAE